MIIQPMIPIWLMAIICAILLVFKRKGWAYIRQILMVALLFVINLRPMLPGKTIAVQEQKYNLNVLFVIDSTLSMLAEDYGDEDAPRLDGVKADCKYIVDELATANFSVITFDNSAHELVPYSDNKEHVQYVIDSVYPLDKIYAKGSNMSVANEMMEDSLKTIIDNNKGETVVFFISDGEVNHKKLEKFSCKDDITYGAVLGYGTSKGGKMHYQSYYADKPEIVKYWDEQYNYKAAISKIDESNLKSIAKDLGVSYVHMEETHDIDGVLDEIKQNVKLKESGEQVEKDKALGADDLYFFLLIPLLLLVLFEMILIVRRKE